MLQADNVGCVAAPMTLYKKLSCSFKQLKSVRMIIYREMTERGSLCHNHGNYIKFIKNSRIRKQAGSFVFISSKQIREDLPDEAGHATIAKKESHLPSSVVNTNYLCQQEYGP